MTFLLFSQDVLIYSGEEDRRQKKTEYSFGLYSGDLQSWRVISVYRNQYVQWKLYV